MTPPRLDARAVREGPAYVQYLYGYPHKTAYRPLPAPVPLAGAWAGEDVSALSLYLHVPYCEHRCGFCNLFSAAGPRGEALERFVEALEREAAVVRRAVPGARFARVAVGGGTPTLLPAPLLARVLDVAEVALGARLAEVPCSVEVSPETATPERVRLLAGRGVSRLSLGVQSFLEPETAALARPQPRAVLEQALEVVRTAGVPTLNLDLIYGIPGQTPDSWLQSLAAALRWRPEELYLYPLYLRPRTYLGERRAEAEDDAHRLGLYRLGRDFLEAAGYRQRSMRCFRAPHAPAPAGPAHRCQEDGMLGLGVGARSYTRTLHYSSPWAVSPRAVRGLIEAHGARDDAALGQVAHGFVLDEAEQRRRHLILSLLDEGLAEADFRARFGLEAGEAFPELAALREVGLVAREAGAWRLTEAGLERSDAVGPWLQSEEVRRRMDAYEVR